MPSLHSGAVPALRVLYLFLHDSSDINSLFICYYFHVHVFFQTINNSNSLKIKIFILDKPRAWPHKKLLFCQLHICIIFLNRPSEEKDIYLKEFKNLSSSCKDVMHYTNAE